jgi:hypothetical protein
MKLEIEKKNYLGPINTITFSNDEKYIFSGIGPYFCIFSTENGELLFKQFCFEGGFVKGIP